jgi:hypothetical protein
VMVNNSTDIYKRTSHWTHTHTHTHTHTRTTCGVGVTSPGLGLVKLVCNGIDQNFGN